MHICTAGDKYLLVGLKSGPVYVYGDNKYVKQQDQLDQMCSSLVL
jgi:hypothetical protein